MINSKNIFIAPLNWGLGHATRCIPIIKELLLNGYTPIIGSDGEALNLLKKEFPYLEHVQLPSYNIKYAKREKYFSLKLFFNSPKIYHAIIKEKRLVNKLIKQNRIDGIISDNRLGVYSKKIPSVYITHQLNVLSGKSTILSTKLHQNIIKKFKECWVPDIEGFTNLSGKLGHLKKTSLNIKYIGPLSRLEKKNTPIVNDFMVLLSGPEPQRTILEEKLYNDFKKTDYNVVFVRGKVEQKQEHFTFSNIKVYNYMTSSELEEAINSSHVIISRSGYTTIMDLAKLEKKAFFIPTPGQFEQQYLAKRLKNQKIVPYTEQAKFSLNNLNEIDLYKGLKSFNTNINYSTLFEIFNQTEGSKTLSKVNENSEPTPSSLST